MGIFAGALGSLASGAASGLLKGNEAGSTADTQSDVGAQQSASTLGQEANTKNGISQQNGSVDAQEAQLGLQDQVDNQEQAISQASQLEKVETDALKAITQNLGG